MKFVRQVLASLGVMVAILGGIVGVFALIAYFHPHHRDAVSGQRRMRFVRSDVHSAGRHARSNRRGRSGLDVAPSRVLARNDRDSDGADGVGLFRQQRGDVHDHPGRNACRDAERGVRRCLSWPTVATSDRSASRRNGSESPEVHLHRRFARSLEGPRRARRGRGRCVGRLRDRAQRQPALPS
jgi:hypothetical protein